MTTCPLGLAREPPPPGYGSAVTTAGICDRKEQAKLNHTEAVRPTPAPAVVVDGAHLLVVIDHRQARVFKTELRGAVPQRIVPYDRDGLGRHLHEVEGVATGKRRPERKSFYEAVARTLRDAAEVVVFGHGTGASSAMDQLVAELTRFHPELARLVVGTFAVDGYRAPGGVDHFTTAVE
jgi:hypothetical protein